MVEQRLGALVPEMPAPDHRGPFASKFVLEDLGDLYRAELDAIGTVRVPRDLSNPHQGLRSLLLAEDRRRAKKEASEYSWTQGALFDNPFDKRRLRILNGLFRALDKRDATGDVSDRDADLQAVVEVGDISVSVAIEPAKAGRANDYGRTSGYADLPANAKLRIVVRHHWNSNDSKTWVDTDKTIVEQSLHEVAASIIMLGEAGYRRSLQQRAEWLEEERQRKEAARLERIEKAEAERLVQLRKSGELLRQAGEIRALVALVKDSSASLEFSASHFEAWERWAHDYADRIDPVKSGQVLLHLLPPSIDEE